MSTVLANTITAVGGGGSTVKVNNDATFISEGGAVTDSNLVQGLTKVWVNYDAVDQGVRGSYNQSSLTDNGTGDFTTNHTNNLLSAEDKCASFNGWNTTDEGSNIQSAASRGAITGDQAGDSAASTSTLNWHMFFGSTGGANGGAFDFDGNYCSILGDLA